MADSKKTPTDAQLLARLRRRKSPATATELGLPSRGGADRLRALEGVNEVHRRQTGKAGRPPAQFVAAAVPDHGQVSKPTKAEVAAAEAAHAEMAVEKDSQTA
jgi:predicted ArsR family transcriptional regulator